MPGVEFSDWTDFGHMPISRQKCHPNHVDRMEEGCPPGAKGFRDQEETEWVPSGQNDSLRLEGMVLWQWGGCKDFNAGTEQLRLDWGSGSGEGEPMGAEVLVGICKSL